ncbi:hypothetical protein BGW36DRAFT_406504, partial [Talaromyces proteolyticus]
MALLSQTSNQSMTNNIDICRSRLRGIQLRLRLLQVKRNLTEEQFHEDAEALELLIEENDMKVRIQELLEKDIEMSESTVSADEPQKTANSNFIPPEDGNWAGHASSKSQTTATISDRHIPQYFDPYPDVTTAQSQRGDFSNLVVNEPVFLQADMPEIGWNESLVHFPDESFVWGLNRLGSYDGPKTAERPSASLKHTSRVHHKSNTSNESTFWDPDATQNETSDHHGHYTSILNVNGESNSVQINPSEFLSDLGSFSVQMAEKVDEIGFGNSEQDIKTR